MEAKYYTENKFIEAINSSDFKENVDAIAYALVVLESGNNRIDFEDLIHKYLDNSRLEVVLDTLNPFEHEQFEPLYKQDDKEEMLKEFLKFASFDGMPEAQLALTKKLSEESFFDLSYALAINDKKNMFGSLNVDYIQNKMKFDDVKLLVSSFDENIHDKVDTRRVNVETKVFADFARKSTSQAGLIVAFRAYEFAVDCVVNNVDLEKLTDKLKTVQSITHDDLQKIKDKLSGNKKEISLLEYTHKERRIEGNINRVKEIARNRERNRMSV